MTDKDLAGLDETGLRYTLKDRTCMKMAGQDQTRMIRTFLDQMSLT